MRFFSAILTDLSVGGFSTGPPPLGVEGAQEVHIGGERHVRAEENGRGRIRLPESGEARPDWSPSKYLSKSDVYGYGIVLLETISGRRNFDVLEKTGWKKFSVWAYKGYIGGTVDKRLNENHNDAEQLKRAIEFSPA
ncbi:G-type lectin S-receptor-like serine/threonine-protein kinase [Acorus gramineus]|uniref:G-type lectin S-receptor-like serine/threonine-protein kinase n=1 Tax=Acorus gramineus TaxID=55184 RepID=A0AAV9A2R3_ACOGR|nr:G-type lectin S-receptor-like serine/threonine-protein kinase [Acorus gramineus]